MTKTPPPDPKSERVSVWTAVNRAVAAGWAGPIRFILIAVVLGSIVGATTLLSGNTSAASALRGWLRL